MRALALARKPWPFNIRVKAVPGQARLGFYDNSSA
jgi:hypothetical protein